MATQGGTEGSTTPQIRDLIGTLKAALMCAAVVAASGCGGSNEAKGRLSADYDSTTGKLRLIRYDSNGNGIVDTWSHMDGARVLRIDVDKNEDGRMERWEHYGPEGTLVKVGFSRSNDGVEDAWTYGNPDGSVARIEVSTRRNGVVNRVESYERNALKQAEEDSDGNGRIDKWEAYDDTGRLVSVAFDTKGRGIADRRVIYGPNGGVATVVPDP